MKLPRSLEKLINEFSKLPGIGPKSAQRLAFYLLKKDTFDLDELARAVGEVKKDVVFCSICHNMADTDPCNICTDPARDKSIICVVEEPMDAQALDRTGDFRGLFHILGGVLNPMEGIGPEKLNIDSLTHRVEQDGVKEIIIATNPTLEGETTANHLNKLLRPLGVTTTRIARGLPMGSDMEYADDMTLSRAMEGRREI